jgi:hypothetical protein
MTLLIRSVGVISLITIATNTFGQDGPDPQPKLSAQYAEVVLHVEGMT